MSAFGMMEIRSLRKSEYPLLDDFLYMSIYVHAGDPQPPRSILTRPELRLYTENFGQKKGDLALAAESGGEIKGIVWARFMRDYGWVSDDVPSLAIAVRETCRGRGIGTKLLAEMLRRLAARGDSAVSLSVQKENRACALYFRLGFEVFRENPEEYVLLCPLRNPSDR